MKTVVCLKEVSSRETRYQVESSGQWIEEGNVTFEINECDEYALEEALKLKEEYGGEVVILTVGKSRAEKIMRKALAKGADRGILILDEDRALASPYSVAAALAKVLESEGFDLVLAGTQSDDFGYGQTGPMLAEMLSVPHATIVMEIQPTENGSLKVLREMESGWFQWISLPVPSLLTIQAGISSLRFASLKGIMQAKRKEIKKISSADLGLDFDSFPQVQLLRLYLPQQEKTAELLEGDSTEVVEALVDKLQKEAKVL